MTRLKSVFFGTPDFAMASYKACLENTELLAVVTQPDRPRGRGHKLSPCPVREAAQKAGLANFAPSSLRKPSPELNELQSFLDTHKPDIFVVTAYGNIMPESFLFFPRLGSVNVHASLLPKWRGAAPIQRSLEAGEQTTGVSLQQMVYALDAGDVLLEKTCPVGPNTNAFELSETLANMGGELLTLFFENPNIKGQSQDPQQVSLAAKITKDEGFWKPEWTASQTHNRIRAFAAWPQVKARLGSDGPEMKLLQSSLFACANSDLTKHKAGTIILKDSKVFLATHVRSGEPTPTSPSNEQGSVMLELIKVQVAGKGPVLAYDFFRTQNHGFLTPLD